MKKLTKLFRNRKGFTLVELVVVIAVLGILALLAVPRLAGFTDKAKQADDKELASIIAHSTATLIATGDIKVATSTASIAVAVASGELSYTPSGLTNGATSPAALNAGDLKDLLEPLVGDDKTLSGYLNFTIPVQSDGDVPVSDISYTPLP